MKAFLSLFEQRVRGVRLVEVIGFSLAIAMIFWVCVSKAREGEDIRRMNELDQQIVDQKADVASLKIKVAQLERPQRLEALARAYLDMQPLSSSHEADLESIGEISRTTSRAVPAPAPVMTPVATTPATPATDGLATAPPAPKGTQ